MLNGELAAGFAAIFGPVYSDGFLRRHERTDDGKGAETKTPTEINVKVQVDRAGQLSQRQGYEEGDAKIIILADGIDGVQADDELVVGVVTWRLSAPECDPLKTHWTCRGRRKP